MYCAQPVESAGCDITVTACNKKNNTNHLIEKSFSLRIKSIQRDLIERNPSSWMKILKNLVLIPLADERLVVILTNELD
jgi:hypothetical protein